MKIKELQESQTIELKQCCDENGNFQLGKSFWETYSAFANSNGGKIFLGVQEKNGKVAKVIGIKKVDNAIKQLFDLLNNQEKVSCNLVSSSDIQIHSVGNKKVLEVEIPPATRKQKPIYINNNILTGTYKRDHESDYRCSQILVQHMLRDKDLNYDNQIPPCEYSMDTISDTSLRSYRNHFQGLKPENLLNDVDDIEFLSQIGAWTNKTQSGQGSLTIAGLLMFGKYQVIQEVFPKFFLDYELRDAEDIGEKYLDRYCTEPGSANNVYEFYLAVMRKLSNELKQSSNIKGGITRVDENAETQIYREALVNALIHADYYLPAAVTVHNLPNGLVLRNPGSILVEPELAFQGGYSECRNPVLQQLFRLIGFSEQRGQGLYLIYNRWMKLYNNKPVLKEIYMQRSGVYTELRLNRIKAQAKKGFQEATKLSVGSDLSTLAKVRGSERSSKRDIEAAILEIAEGQFVTPVKISQMLNRDISLVRRYLRDLFKKGKLKRKYPTASHPGQMYIF